ncbi:MAG: G5 domain-containing protein [Lachnospiraceae bacterium]|nr:G5 domain-containing protein [Lachnospiraceae bacterium]
MSIEDRIEIVESYLPQKELTSLKDAISEVTKDKETNKIYEVKAGDTLSVIAQKYGLTVAKLVSMNPTLENENSLIRPQDELIVTVPEPLLTIAHQTEAYLEEDYEAEVKYVDNPSWYTDETKVLQDPVAGHRKVIALEMYSNENLTGRQIIKEEVVAPAVPKIVERGTRVRPTYIKPISGGRLSSGFGRQGFQCRNGDQSQLGKGIRLLCLYFPSGRQRNQIRSPEQSSGSCRGEGGSGAEDCSFREYGRLHRPASAL